MIFPKFCVHAEATNWFNFALTGIKIAQEFLLSESHYFWIAKQSHLPAKKGLVLRPGDKLEIFEELARIFSGENNALAQRELLVREGTARFADTVGENDHHMQKILQKHSENSRVNQLVSAADHSR